LKGKKESWNIMEQHYDFRKVAGNNMHIKIGIPRTCEKE
jgi:hypothetical protein